MNSGNPLEKIELDVLHNRFIAGLATFGAGSGAILIDAMKVGTVLLGFLGAVLAVVGGYDAWRAKRTERKIRELQLARLEARQDRQDHP